MVDSLCGCFSIFIFCTIILSIFLSIFAIFFVQGATTYIENTEDADPDTVVNLTKHFGSVGMGMLSLFKAATGGDDWTVFYDTVTELGPMYSLLFIAFMASYLLAFFNVITAVFCEKAISLAQPTLNELIHRRREKEFNDARELVALLRRVMGDSGTEGSTSQGRKSQRDGEHNTRKYITLKEFDTFIRSPEVEIYFEVRGLKSLSAKKFFKTLCQVYGSDRIDFATFISTCVRLDGRASTIDTHITCLQADLLKGNFDELTHDWSLHATNAHRKIDELKGCVASSHAQHAKQNPCNTELGDHASLALSSGSAKEAKDTCSPKPSWPGGLRFLPL